MHAFIVYMQWLDEQAAARGLHPPASAFPPMATLSGDGQLGGMIFRQKCTFWPDSRGQGRYLNGLYFRPAHWGAQSFNRQTGLADTTKMGPFLKANMPHRFGGALTDQEAWDLAVFIDRQERPEGPSEGRATATSHAEELRRPRTLSQQNGLTIHRTGDNAKAAQPGKNQSGRLIRSWTTLPIQPASYG